MKYDRTKTSIRKRISRSKPLALIFLLLFTNFALTGCSTDKTTVARVRNVKVAPSVFTAIDLSINFGGRLKPLAEVAVSAKISGKVEQVNVNIGDTIQKGDVLFTLDNTEAGIRVDQARAAYDEAQGQIRLKIDDAQEYYDKILQLYNAGAISQQELNQAESQLTAAQLAWNQVEQAKASLNLAQLQLADTTVPSPLTGVVSARNVEPGEIISAGSPAFTVIDTQTLVAEISVPASLIAALKTGQKAVLAVTSLGDREFTGIIDSITPNASTKTNAYGVRINVENPDGELRPDMFVHATFPGETGTNVLAVPNEAIVIDNELQYVYIVNEDNMVKRVPVKAGISDRKMTEIIEGLQVGDLVIIEGQSFVRDGDPVTIINTTTENITGKQA